MNAVTFRLSVMMFIQFFIWGAWYVTGPLYLGPLGFTGQDFGNMYSVGPIAGIISPFFVGMIADRFFNVERVLGVMHLGAAAAMFGAAALMQVENPNPNMINLMFFVHMLFYFPTLALVNTLAMRNITDTEKQFPLIRVLGTIGWIIAGLTISFFAWDTHISMFHLAAGAALIMGVYSFSLPRTPPAPSQKKPTIGQLLGFDALVMFKRPSFIVFMASSFLICIPLAFYYQMAAKVVQQADLVPGRTMSYGQMSEIFFMLIMPLFFKRLGVKWMLAIGMLAWVARYALFAIGAPDQVVWMIIGGVVLHGICYDFFFVTGQIYTDKAAPKHIRGQAQGMLVLFTLGLGMLIGAQIGGRVEGAFTPSQTGRLLAEANLAGTAVQMLPGTNSSTLADAAPLVEKLDIDGLFDQFCQSVGPVNEISGPATAEVQAKIDAAQQNLDVFKNAHPGLLDAEKQKELSALTEAVVALQKTKQQQLAATAGDLIRPSLGGDVQPAIADAVIAQAGGTLISRYSDRKALQGLRLVDWKSIWMYPAIGAGVILVIFCITFKDNGTKPADVGEGDVATAAAIEQQP